MTNDQIKMKSEILLQRISNIIIKDPAENDIYGRPFLWKKHRFDQAVDLAFKEITMEKPGRKLFKRLLKSPAPIKISLDSDISNIKAQFITTYPWIFSNTDQAFTPHLDIAIFFPANCLLDKDENRLDNDNYSIALGIAHELIHVMHRIENSDKYEERRRETHDLFNRTFTNQEEQLTICGALSENDDVDICENAFVKAFGRNFRMSHQELPNAIE
jgi:hypothetical protein